MTLAIAAAPEPEAAVSRQPTPAAGVVAPPGVTPHAKASVPLQADDDSLYRRLVDGISDYAIYMLDPTGVVSSWNAGAQRFKGYRPDEIIGCHFSRFYTDEDRANGKPMRALGISASEGRYEERGIRVRKDGSCFRAHVIIDAIRDPDGSIVGYAKVTRDVSEAWEQEQALRASEQRFRLLVSGVTDYAIYLLDLEGRVNSWNAGAERFKGYKADEIIGHHFSTFYQAEDRQSGRPARALATALREGRYEDSGWRVRKDGTSFWAHVVVDLIRDDDGQPIGYAKITRDISERRAADLRLRELTASNEELEQFIQIASHDLREPLRKVLAFCDLLVEDEGERLSPDGRGYIGSITAATRRMQGLLASLLSLSRVTSQGRSFDPCQLDAVLADVRSDLQVAIAERSARIHCEALPELEADEAQMRQLFQNLIENSIKYARQGVAPDIRVRALPEADPEFVRIECRDNGIGFEPQYAERIFGVFQRLHSRDQYGGAGVGLSICRKICVRHGGSISAEGLPGQGSRFTIRLRRRHVSDVC